MDLRRSVNSPLTLRPFVDFRSSTVQTPPLSDRRACLRETEKSLRDDPVFARSADRHVVSRQQVPAGLPFDLVDELHQRHERAAIIGASRQSGAVLVPHSART